MNYRRLKKKMDKFFKTVSSEKLIKDFEAMGHQFKEMSEEEKKEWRRNNCTACRMIQDGVKFRRAPKHTCRN
jgi:hypothetical protein